MGWKFEEIQNRIFNTNLDEKSEKIWVENQFKLFIRRNNTVIV